MLFFSILTQMNLDLFYPLVSVLYALVGWHFWRTRWRTTQPGAVWEKMLPLPALVLHALLLVDTVSNPAGLNLGVGNALSAIIWLAVLIYWLGSFRYRLEILLAPLAALAAAAVLTPLALPATHVLGNTELLAFRVHLIIALLAYSLFTIAALHAALMAMVEKRLHNVNQSGVVANLPPLLTLESLLFRIIGVGFVLLTLTLASGMLFSEELFHEPMQFNHKTIFAILSWVVFAALLSGRRLWGWRGRIAIRWTLAGFVMLVLAYIGSKFVLEILLRR